MTTQPATVCHTASQWLELHACYHANQLGHFVNSHESLLYTLHSAFCCLSLLGLVHNNAGSSVAFSMGWFAPPVVLFTNYCYGVLYAPCSCEYHDHPPMLVQPHDFDRTHGIRLSRRTPAILVFCFGLFACILALLHCLFTTWHVTASKPRNHMAPKRACMHGYGARHWRNWGSNRTPLSCPTFCLCSWQCQTTEEKEVQRPRMWKRLSSKVVTSYEEVNKAVHFQGIKALALLPPARTHPCGWSGCPSSGIPNGPTESTVECLVHMAS